MLLSFGTPFAYQKSHPRENNTILSQQRHKAKKEKKKIVRTINNVVEVDVGIAEGAAGDSITADTDRGDGANRVEHLEQHGLIDRGVQLADVQGGRSCGGSGGDGGEVGSLGSLGLSGGNLLLLFQAEVVGGRGSGSGNRGSGFGSRHDEGDEGRRGGWIYFFFGFFRRMCHRFNQERRHRQEIGGWR